MSQISGTLPSSGEEKAKSIQLPALLLLQALVVSASYFVGSHALILQVIHLRCCCTSIALLLPTKQSVLGIKFTEPQASILSQVRG